MKNAILFLVIIITIAACQNKKDTSNNPEQASMYIAPVYNNSDTAKTSEVNNSVAKVVKRRAKPAAIKNNAPVAIHRDVTPEINTLPPIETSPVVTAPVPTSTGVSTLPAPTGVGNNTGTETAASIPEPEKKKGWSKAAKGAAIGAGAGAIGGVILSKKKGLGAVIGGVVGAAGGYIIGKGMDKKDNRLVADK